jgi:hypothetical protein
MTDQPLTRRQLRDQQDPPPVEAPKTRREVRDLERMRELQSSTEPVELPTTTGPSSILEPKALVLESVPDLTNLSVVLPDSGSVLTTGSIELPWLKSETGQTQVIAAAEDADTALAETYSDTNTLGITPIPARHHERTRRRSSVFPTRLRKGWGVVHLVLVSAFLLLALLVGLLAAYMLGIISL